MRKQIDDARTDYTKDLDAMTHEQLAATPGGSARSAYDFTYETAFVNRRIAKRLRGETPEPHDSEAWIMAPEEFKAKDVAKQELDASLQEVLEAWDRLDAKDLQTAIKLPSSETNALNLAHMAAHHTAYHDAQLNYLQSIHGDDKVHWD
ncbi:MAG: hypothetical protein QOJ65_693 [Fimbriimonadaceae bacterium]|nr:hypothetical protein [Fimbriimonadaceae bacterium]